jgi:hypothetical protein
LKEIGTFIGATWSSNNASGIQSLVWRNYWDKTHNAFAYKKLLLTYNQEDCNALRLLVNELSKIQHSADVLTEVDYANQMKRQTTEVGEGIHYTFSEIIKFAHSNYDKKKIKFHRNIEKKHNRMRKSSPKKGYQGQRKIRPKPSKKIIIPCDKVCPICSSDHVKPTMHSSKRLIIDLILTKNGVRKTIVEYVGKQVYCSICKRNYAPKDIRKFGVYQLYGHGFKSWFVYHRIAMRLPHQKIEELIKEQFNEILPWKTGGIILNVFAEIYSETVSLIIQNLLKSNIIHADETQLSIRGETQYAWVFTDGKNIVFKLSETREADIVHEFLADYKGVLISDFYSGYDSVNCIHQKCWVHLIRNINDDLWKEPYDMEFEGFVMEVYSLILPIMEAVQKYGLRKRHLRKFNKQVEQFYKNAIVDKFYKSDVTIKYQKRFKKYRDSLFTFLNDDNIPWNNNAAELAIRHLALQRKISGSFHKSGAQSYLSLLSIKQTCRFHNKSFFRFLFSERTDLYEFETRKRNQCI